MESNTYLIIQIAFVLLTFVSIGLLTKVIFSGIALSSFTEARKSKIKGGIITSLIVWLIITSALSLSGFLKDFSNFPPHMMIVLVIPLFIIIGLMFTKTLKEILTSIPEERLIHLQAFRIFVEVLLWMLFLQNMLPVQMSFEGRNFDVLAGLSAPIVAWLFKDNKKVLIAWNFLGLGLLLNIVTIAVLSFPTTFRVFMNEPANTIVAYFPIVFLPAFLVPMAYTIHLFVLKKLMMK